MTAFSEFATVTGKGGIFRVVKALRAGFILEGLDENKTRLVTSPGHKVSLLEEISVYTNTREGTLPLREVLIRIFKEYGEDTGVDYNSDGTKLRAFLKSVVPDHDESKVYVSDIRKIVKWYGVLLQHAPEILHSEPPAGDKDAGQDKNKKK